VVSWFIAFKFNEASSSDYPPERNVTPTNAGGTVLLKAKAVLYPISYGVTLLLSELVDPGVTMFGLRRQPSKKILFSFKALKTAASTLSVTF
jgi:hypothetical protein